MKKLFVAVFILTLTAAVAGAQVAPTPQAATPQPSATAKTLAEYMQPIQYDGIQLNFVVVNATTSEILFQAPLKYAMRARAAQSTILYVQGTPQKDMDFSTNFTIVQNGKTIATTPTNIKNFVNGKVTKGERIDGYLTFAEKVDLTTKFTLKYANGSGVVNAHDFAFPKQ